MKNDDVIMKSRDLKHCLFKYFQKYLKWARYLPNFKLIGQDSFEKSKITISPYVIQTDLPFFGKFGSKNQIV